MVYEKTPNPKAIASGASLRARRPRFQFSLAWLMLLMGVVSAAAAPGYYFTHGTLPEARLIGMLMMLAGPLLIMTLLSVFLSFVRRG